MIQEYVKGGLIGCLMGGIVGLVVILAWIAVGFA